MEQSLPKLLALSFFSLAISACKETSLNNQPGKYENFINFTQADGSANDKQSSAENTGDVDGKRQTLLKKQTIKEPEKLFNNSQISTTQKTIGPMQ